MTNKRYPHPHPHPRPHQPQAPSLDPDTGEPVGNVAAAPAPSDAGVPTVPAAPSEVDVWKDRHLRLAAEYDNFRKRTIKERAEAWTRAQAELVSRLADALDDLSRFAHIDPAEIDSKTLHEGVGAWRRLLFMDWNLRSDNKIDSKMCAVERAGP